MERARIIYGGKVQGVFFRANCLKNALGLDLKGWVRNLDNGNVEEMVEGDSNFIQEHITWNRTQQPHARVLECEVEWMPAEGEFKDFRIIR